MNFLWQKNQTKEDMMFRVFNIILLGMLIFIGAVVLFIRGNYSFGKAFGITSAALFFAASFIGCKVNEKPNN